MPRGYVTENRPGFPGAFVRVHDETPAEAREREAAWDAHCRAIERADDLMDERTDRMAVLADDEPEEKAA